MVIQQIQTSMLTTKRMPPSLKTRPLWTIERTLVQKFARCASDISVIVTFLMVLFPSQTIVNWFYHHSIIKLVATDAIKPKTSAGPKAPFMQLNLSSILWKVGTTAPPRQATQVQTYSCMYWELILKPLAQSKWDLTLAGMAQKPMSLAWCNLWTCGKFDQATIEEKALIQARWEAMYNDDMELYKALKGSLVTLELRIM